jgi:acyl-CoA synthetase (AMP-forming)/AMP-acid ligase II
MFGYIASTINFRLAAPEMQQIIEDAKPHILIFEDSYTDHVEAIRSAIPSVKRFVAIGNAPSWAEPYEALLAEGDPAGPPLDPPTADMLAFLMYTSGSTGRPKGVMQEHGAQAVNGSQIADCLGMTASDRTLLMMPFFHVGAKAVAVGQSWKSGCIHIHRAFEPEEIFRTIERERITITHLAPTMIQTLLEHPARTKFDLSSLRTVLYSAAAMPTAMLRRAIEAFGPVFVQMYGQTEGSGTVLPREAHEPDGDERTLRRLSSVGHPIPGSRFRVVDDEDRELPAESSGELCYQGPVMMRGYWNNSAATIETMRGGWIHTGDVAKIDEDGYIYLVDRKRDMIISGGENISSREVEEALLRHPAVSEVAVIGVPHEKWGEAVAAVVVARFGTDVSAADLIAHCRSLIAGYKRPQSIIFVDELPRLPSGKITKVELRKQFDRLRDDAKA